MKTVYIVSDINFSNLPRGNLFLISLVSVMLRAERVELFALWSYDFDFHPMLKQGPLDSPDHAEPIS